MLEDGIARFDQLVATRADGSHSWYRVTLHEGRNREVRRLWLAVGHEVSRLTRLRYGPIELPDDLRAGEWRRLDATQVAALRAAAA
jgi:23S rRNA pseudouridine2605 synthase